MKKNYLKIGLIALVLAGLVAPLAIGMAVDRPVTKIERCTLRHDFTKTFGSSYKRGATIEAQTYASGGTSGGQFDFPTGVTVGKSDFTGTAASIVDTSLALTDVAILSAIYPGCRSVWDAAMSAYNNGTFSKGYYDAISVGSLQNESCSKVVGLGDAWGDAKMRLREKAKVKALAGGTSGTAPMEDASIVCLLDLIETVGDWLFAVVLIFAGIFILWGGATMVFAAGSPEKIKKARDILIWAGVGVAIAFLSKGLIKLVEQIIA